VHSPDTGAGRAGAVSRRQALRLFGGAGLAAGSLALGGCTITKGTAPISTQGLSKDPAPGRKTNIEVYSIFGGTVGQGWVKLASRYEQVQKDVGVRVTYAPGTSSGEQQKLLVAIAANSPPDVAQLIPFETPQWADLGIMKDLTPYFERDGLSEKDFIKTAWKGMSYRGRVWQLQWDADPNFPFFWNKDLFEKAGLDPDKPPRTIDEVDEFSKKINQTKGRNVTTIGMVPWTTYGYANSIFWMVSGSLKDIADLNSFPVVWFPHKLTLENYIYGLRVFPFARYFGNTLLICVLSMTGAALSSSFIAYGLARIDWPLRKPLFIIILGTMMIPFYVTMVPLFSLFRSMGWVNTYLPLIVPTFFGVPFYIFLLRQFFMSIPRDLSDAARIDGANEFAIYARIILPLAKPALAAVALFQFLVSWSDLLGPLIYLSNSSSYTVSLGLTFYRSQYSTQYGPLMAASTVVVIPVVILFFFAQRTFIQGITLTGVKG
jgi:multiple sugar transport system permease protein